jgi:hypothetical protein
VADRPGGRRDRPDAAREDLPAGPPAPDPAQGRAVLHPAAHRARRLHRVVGVLAVVAAGAPRPLRRDRPDRRAARRRGGVGLPARGRGDELDVRGPVGGFFVWPGDERALLVAGGSGVVPPMAMLRLARRTGHADLLRLLVSVRTPDDLYFAAELPGPETSVVYTRAAPTGAARGAGRLTLADVAPLVRGGRDGVRVRLGRVRRGRHRPAARCRGAHHVDPGGAVRPVELTGVTQRSRADTFGWDRRRSRDGGGRGAPSW